ncbi:hypothetical protein B0H17DRAFT_1027885 [Mycena rosella]|uniref:Uncharacterized protein n=1 Tax=Mycena rosella TaxID=1033263 RepID=A0AAD7H2X2_MYCRO|nr:hypothetical protein B0H17DRAFT_1027885 [Mycena rosella]
MATTMGTPSYYYPTPRSSGDGPNDAATRTASASEPRTVPSRVLSDRPKQAVYVSQTPFTGLHTPSTSADLKHDASGPEVSSDSITTLLGQINCNDFAVTGVRSKKITGIELETWAELKDKHLDALDCRLEYLTEMKALIVTYPSATHESFNVLFKPFVNIADATPTLAIHTNLDILLPSGSSVTPDLSFAEVADVGDIPKFHIVFECAWAQPLTLLEEKIPKYFTRDDVLAVVCLFIHTSKKYEGKEAPPPQDYTIISAAEVKANLSAPLGAILIDNHTWGPEIDGIDLTIYHRNGTRQLFVSISLPTVTTGVDSDSEEFCPVAGKFTEEQIQAQFDIDKALVKLLVKAVTVVTLGTALGNNTFELGWPEFLRMLAIHHFSDAYNRYLRWARRPLKRKVSPDVELADAVKEEEDSDEAASLLFLRRPPAKKPKIE